MAIRAHDLAFTQRHVRRAEHLRAPVLVALEAGVRLERGLQLRLARHRLHDGVAIGARQTARFVGAAGPISAIAALMAGETNRVLFFGRARIGFAESHDATNPASAAGLRVRGAGTVAVLAGELARLRDADAAHERRLEFRDERRMATRANLVADEVGFDRSAGLFSGGGWALRRRGIRSELLYGCGQPFHQILRFGQLRLALDRFRLRGP